MESQIEILIVINKIGVIGHGIKFQTWKFMKNNNFTKRKVEILLRSYQWIILSKYLHEWTINK